MKSVPTYRLTREAFSHARLLELELRLEDALAAWRVGGKGAEATLAKVNAAAQEIGIWGEANRVGSAKIFERRLVREPDGMTWREYVDARVKEGVE